MKRTGVPLIENRVKRMRLGDQDNAGDRHQETALDPIKSGWQIFRGPPPYTHASVAAIYENKFSETTNRWGRDHAVRMTGPSTPFKNISYTDLNAGGGTQSYGAIGTGSEVFRTTYWDFYTSMYKYYSVLACRYHITFENLSADKLYVHIMNYNQTVPPENASNHDMLLWGDCKSFLSTPHGVWYNYQQMRDSEADGNNYEDEAPSGAPTNNDVNSNWAISRAGGSPIISYSSQYEAGQTQQEIVLDENVSTWTSTSANPSLEENLLVRIKAYDDATQEAAGNSSNYGRVLSYNLKIQVEYLVEFRELKEGLRWPVRRNPIELEINNLNNQ